MSLEKRLKLVENQARSMSDIDIIKSPQWVEFKTLILDTLNDYPEVKAVVVDRLRSLLVGGEKA